MKSYIFSSLLLRNKSGAFSSAEELTAQIYREKPTGIGIPTPPDFEDD
ncbi:MAG: hypothetical protein Q7T11_05860 [Deltaproteobacteria bacterium]|nr:hypothetical protein [Deltaproteobacteria bacterium]